MIKKEDLIWGSVIELESKKFPAIINGSNEKETVFDVVAIIYYDDVPKLTREHLPESNLEKCHPARFDDDDLTPFVNFRNYGVIAEKLKKKGYTLTKDDNNTRTISWIDAGKEHKEVFNEVHLFQKFIHEKINEYLEVYF